MDRRKFVRSSLLASGIAMLPSRTVNAKSINRSDFGDKVIYPGKLSKGDTIGLIAPSSGVDRGTFERTLEHIDELGFKTFYSDRLRVQKGFLAGTDQIRADDIQEMFSNKNIDGIMCVRGGYGSARLLDILDYSVIKKNPKPLIGYSDITALLYGIHKNTGLICFHGPVGVSSVTPFNKDIFEKELIEGNSNIVISRPQKWEEVENIAYKKISISSGIASGKLVGGNLSVMMSLIGTPHDVDFSNKIVFIEEVHESPYRIDRMLTQLLQTGKLDKAKGIALGVFRGCDYEPDDKGYDTSLSLYEVLMDRLSVLKIPVVYGLPFGHIKENAVLPFGGLAELNSDECTLTLLESPVL